MKQITTKSPMLLSPDSNESLKYVLALPSLYGAFTRAGLLDPNVSKGVVMKNILMLMLFGLLSIHAYALSGTTKGGHVACLTEEWLDDVISFVASDDLDSLQAYLDSNKCVVLKKGLRVTVTEPPSMFGGTAVFVFQGTKLWTIREALEYGD